ncbi:MAG: hypothetical protein ABW185_05055, partial [Sedimenticola sp.]
GSYAYAVYVKLLNVVHCFLTSLTVFNCLLQIFNVDETGWSGKEKCTTKVIAPKTGHVFRNKVTTNDHVTANLCISAEGKFLPTMVIFQVCFVDPVCE